LDAKLAQWFSALRHMPAADASPNSESEPPEGTASAGAAKRGAAHVPSGRKPAGPDPAARPAPAAPQPVRTAASKAPAAAEPTKAAAPAPDGAGPTPDGEPPRPMDPDEARLAALDPKHAAAVRMLRRLDGGRRSLEELIEEAGKAAARAEVKPVKKSWWRG
jgi:hypothetical protein